MPCYDPRGCHDNDGIATVRPCGQCIGCRFDTEQDWAVRLTLESEMYEENCFLTLTLNPENLPKDGSVHTETLTKFVKDLRNHLTNNQLFGCETRQIKYFGCGEYGEICKNCGLSLPICSKRGCKHFIPTIGRPHYHIIILNYDFPDKELLHSGQRKQINTRGYEVYKRQKGSHDLFTSETLDKIWRKGWATIQGVGYESAAYVARYVLKKINGANAKNHYGTKKPEFAIMSRGNRTNPAAGIGKTWFDRYIRDVYPKDYITINGIRFRPPRYFDQLMEKHNHVEMYEIKQRRRKASQEEYPDSTFRQKQKEDYRKRITEKKLERSI